ncbi:TIGR03084 family metal-binding protein [Arthrobacter sp. GMC3]|uniref:TIGR03084 family metal-binding protein n=1 Tax=Arthrobacter sp. GMC3 TaxID=2058894 RepID=UPI000CE2BD13|nr:TIGR03084 family metal-binding protein [Arthrobacter sp. GMC3]
MVELADVLADYEAESAVLDGILAALPAEDWSRPTPAPGWNIGHQLGHLAWTDEVASDAATAAIGDPAAFATWTRALQTGSVSIDSAAAELAALPPQELLERWREGRRRLAASLVAVAPGGKLPWFGPPMSATSMATARIMETWAHGQDIVDALGTSREPTDRLRHIAHLAVRTRDFSFKLNKLTPPEAEFRVELEGPSGVLWTWGPTDAVERVSGPAEDFCLLATRRRHRDELAVTAQGPNAETWLDIVQAFAGPPGEGRKPGTSRLGSGPAA